MRMTQCSISKYRLNSHDTEGGLDLAVAHVNVIYPSTYSGPQKSNFVQNCPDVAVLNERMPVLASIAVPSSPFSGPNSFRVVLPPCLAL